jgi:alpha-1,3-rhamnosyl/mannosyltransferase
MTRRLRLWRERRTIRTSLVHGPNYFLPSNAEGGIITVHDLSVFRYPETHPVDRVRAFERHFSHSLERSAHIITDTETVRRELIEAFSVRPDTVTAIPLGVDPRFSVHTQFSGLQAFDLTSGSYGLCVSTLEPRKKIAELIRAWDKLPNGLKTQFPLVLVGGAGWENDDLHEEIENAARQGWLRHLGFVSEQLLNELYAGSALFIYPSIYEGFGLPPVEAMASGVPVIVANCSCLPEVCGDAARYVDPDDADAFAETIEDSLTNSDWRTQAIAKGLRRASEFKWTRCVDETITVYRKVNGAR